MKEQVAIRRVETGASSTGASRFDRLDSDVRRGVYRSLSRMAFVYAVVYAIAFFYYWGVNIKAHGTFVWPSPIYWIAAAFGITYGVLVGNVARKGTCEPSKFTAMSQSFLLFAAAGIAANYWGWQFNHPVSEFPRVEGVPWIAVIILTFANLVALAPRRMLVWGSLAALVQPVVIMLSVLVLGLPEGATGPAHLFAKPFAMQSLIPGLICVGIAVYVSKEQFDLVEDVSDARRMGSYRLTEKIGEGGMGDVWKGEHQLLTRPAAVKLVRNERLSGHDDSAARTLLARFEREAQATASLTSPHTVEIYDFGVSDGTFYYVMELLEGMDLRTLVEKSGPVPAERAVRFLRQAADSLADAHGVGLIHRDIKPANIYTCRRGLEYDYVKVLDFGLVKETAVADPEGDTQLTVQGITSGTPAFMPPEMARAASDVDGRADLYALGCVGYWLLTGKLVFEANNAVEMLVMHASEAPVPPSRNSEIEIPESVDRLVLDCLAKSPDDRPASAREVSRRLDEIEAEIGRWSQERAERWWGAYLPHLAGPAA